MAGAGVGIGPRGRRIGDADVGEEVVDGVN